LNPIGLEFCRKKHQLPGLDFVHGSAEELPFADQSFDAVVNVEASHCYPELPRFLAEVARVLRPGGHFLYADARKRRYIAEWEQNLREAPMQLVSESVINEQVARGIEKIYLSMFKKRRLRPSFNYRLWSHFHRRLQNNEISYRVYCFAKA
jgi:ubiquinone/menaquinone biosynthesis C-methylase UbiE